MTRAMLSAMRVARSDTSNDRKVAKLRKENDEYRTRIVSLETSIRIVAYNARPTPEIRVTLNYYNGEQAFGVILKSNGTDNGKELMKGIAGAVGGTDPNKIPMLFVTAQAGDPTVYEPVDFYFGAGFAVPKGGPSFMTDKEGETPVSYVMFGDGGPDGGPNVYPVYIGEKAGTLQTHFSSSSFTPLPDNYGRIDNAYDLFWCIASLVLSTIDTSITSSSTPVQVTISANDNIHGENFIDAIVNHM